MHLIGNGSIKGMVLLTTLFLLAACNSGSGTDYTSSVAVSDATDDNSNTGSGSGVVTLSWMPPTDNTDGSSFGDLSGYIIYYGTDASAMSNQITITNTGITTYVIENLASNYTYYFVITALNSTGIESEHSNIASKYISG